MFAAIYIPDFPVEAIVRAEPELREQAVAVVEGVPPLVRVIAVNEKAAQAGVEPDMTKLQAEERLAAMNGCVSTVRQRSAEREAAAHAALLDCACGFSPRVEDTAADTVLVDLAGLQRIFGAPPKLARDISRRCSEFGLETNVAVAANADTAVLAARGFAGVTVIPEGKEADRLGELSVEVLLPSGWGKALTITDCRLPLGCGGNRQSEIDNRKWGKDASSALEDEWAPICAEILDTLERWGVRNLRALAALPPVAVAERLGQHGLHLQKLARGEARRPLVVTEPPLVFEECVELEYAVDTLEPLAFLLNRMLEQLCARLAARALATNEIKLRLDLEIERGGIEVQAQSNSAIPQFANSAIHERTLRLPVPMLDPKVFLKLMQLDLQAHPPQWPVIKVFLRAEPAEPRHAQNGLFLPQAPEAEKLSVTLARIERVVGKSAAETRVGSPEILDTHSPDGFRMKPFSPAASVARVSDPGARVKDPCHTITALRVFRPPLAAVVTLHDGKPAHIASPDRPAMRGEVVWCAGPWQSSGEWWTEQVWSRQEWDVAVRNEEGIALYRIYRDEIGGKWWVEGTYD